MTKILIVDDDQIFQKLVTHALQPLGFELVVANDGYECLTKANASNPDLIVCDVMMPNMNGYEAVKRIRRITRFAHIPILMLTAQSDLNEKLAGFEAGADDYMTKPFAPPELVARVNSLLRKAELFRSIPENQPLKSGKVLAVHSLRGGSGCSSIAVNLGIGLAGLWNKPTIILDLVLTTGQVAMMMNGALRRTWADLTSLQPSEIDMGILSSIIGKHEYGVDYIAAPTFPPEAELLTIEYFDACLSLLRTQYDYLVLDLPHDFRDVTFHALDAADEIILVSTPEMASLRATAAALETYKRLEYPAEKVRLLMNWNFERNGLARKNVETALKRVVDTVLPFDPETTIQAINYGQPFLQQKPEAPISQLVENFAFLLSSSDDKGIPPITPSKAWLRTMKRIRANP